MSGESDVSVVPVAPVPVGSGPPSPHFATSASKGLGGIDKAVTLLISLGPDRAAEVFRHLGDIEIEALSLKMAEARRVPTEAINEIFTEVVENAWATGYFAEGGVGFAREVLENAVGPERANEIIGRLSALIEDRPFEFLRRTPPEQIYTALRSESPQTIALTVANLHTTLAAQVLGQLSEQEQRDVSLKIAAMSETSPEVVREVEKVMRQKLSSVASQDYSAMGGAKGLADIINLVDMQTERRVMEALEVEDPELAEEIRLLLFTFEDTVKLDDRGVQLVLKEVNQKDLVLALRGANDEVKQKILSNMSSRGADMLREEMEFQPPQRRSVVEEAQSRIVAVIRRLEETGAITIGRQEDDELVV
jgi:flagellar motor switch protein FliG